MTASRGSVGVVALLTLSLLAGVALGGAALLGAFLGAVPSEPGAGCEPSGDPGVAMAAADTDAADLTSAQLANAATVIETGRRLGVPRRGVLIALAVASQESRFTNYANDGKGGDLQFTQVGIEQSLRLPHEAVGSDHGSVGVFQQQWPWWGSLRQLMDPATSAAIFYRALRTVPDWPSLPLTVAAQRVQRSAFPGAYADDERLAGQLLGGTPDAAFAAAPVAAAGPATPAAWTGSDGCGDAVEPGRVVPPLPRGAAYADRRNWGSRGARWARMHTGTDLSAACGTPVVAATDGRVVLRTDQPWAGRWLVQVSTGTGRLTTWYAHLRTLTVADGQSVTAGQQLGEVGDLGNASGCHLHFEVHPRGGSIYRDSVDPSRWLRAQARRRTTTIVPAGSSSRSEWFTVATFNVLGASHTVRGRRGMASGAARTSGVVRLLGRYGVDVVGFQEMQRPQQRAFLRRAGHRYALWHPRRDTENAVGWRRDRFTLVSARTLAVPYFGGRIRRMPVLRLRDRRTGTTVALLNVHNPADTRRYPRQGRWRRAAVSREVAMVRRLARGDRTPVILTGDMNDRRQVFCRLTASGLAHASQGPRRGRGCRPPRAAGIDWIFGTGRIRFSDHTSDRGAVVRRTTDHPFVVARARAR